MTDTASWMVILSRQSLGNPMALAKALAAVRKTPLQDQVMVAKNGWGVLAEHMSPAEADQLVQGLKLVGVVSVALPEADFVVLPEAKPVATFDPLITAPPILIAASAITTTSTTTKTVKEGPTAGQKAASVAILLGTGIPVHIGGKTRFVEKTQHHSDQAFYVDVVYDNPRRRLRVDAQRFDYAFLKDRKLYQILGNFKLLVGDLVKKTPAAWHNHGTTVLLENKPIQTMGYGSFADVEREMRWLLTLHSRK